MSDLMVLHNIYKSYPSLHHSKQGLASIYRCLRKQQKQSLGKQILQNISLRVDAGHSLGIIGDNGAGKSTLLKIIAGVLQPTSGTLQVNGSISALLELGSGFHPEYSGLENIDLAGALLGLSQRDIKNNLQQIIEFADIEDAIYEPVKHYSSGMVMRLAFAIATALKPDVLISDEILAVGDESFQKKCIHWLEDYLKNKGTLLLCSHNTFHIQSLCARCLWLKEGQIEMLGDSYEVTQAYLSYHEEKQRETPGHGDLTGLYQIKQLSIENETGQSITKIPMYSQLYIRGLAFSPEDRAPVILTGIVRIDGTPISGTFSIDDHYTPQRIRPQYYAFTLQYYDIPLLPGKYILRAHCMDPEGLRLFDTIEKTIIISGKTREHGLIRIPHHWLTEGEQRYVD